MKIGGLQKLTLLDFPGKVACTVFTVGCNFRCPFCHNAALVTHCGTTPTMPKEEFFAFLKKRQGILDGVAITGGEPTLMSGLYDFIGKIKDMGYLVKLDTNGTNPEALDSLINNKMIDYAAMDIKNSLEKYGKWMYYKLITYFKSNQKKLCIKYRILPVKQLKNLKETEKL